MKGKKTRIGLLLLSAALLMTSLVGCGQNNPSVLKLPDATAVPESQSQATMAPLTALGDRTCRVGQETIPESTLFSFILQEETFDPLMGLTLKLTSTNKSNVRDFVVSLNYLSVNGYMQDSGYEVRVPAGQTMLGEILIPADVLRSAGVSSVDELILYPLIYDDSVPMGQGDVVDGAFSFYPTGQSKGNVVYPIRQRSTTEQTFFDNGFGTLIVLGAGLNEQGELAVNCYLENKTDRFLSFAWSDVTVNNAPVNTTAESVVAPGMRRYVTVPFTGFPENPSELSFKVSATPLSSTGAELSPLMEQRGVYRFAVTESTPADPDDPGDGDGGYTEGGDIVAATPADPATPAPTTIVYTSPTTAQKKNAKKGYVNADKVNMRAGPGTTYKTVGKKVAENSTATLYELQDGWWFLKCNGHYGYIKSNYITQGKPKATPVAEDAVEGDGKSLEGTVTTKSIAALRKEADKESKCLKELSDGTKVSVHYKTKGKDGESWYYVSYGKSKGYIRTSLVKVKGKVPSK